MRANGTTTRGTPRVQAPLREERGMVLVITMIIMLVVSTLAAASLINAYLERSLAKNQNNASVALNAADGGVSAGVAWLNDDTNLATIPIVPNPWTRPGDPVIRALGSGGTYDVTLSFLADEQDQDCDGDTTDIVIFNKGGFVAGTTTELPCPHDGLFLYEGAIFSGGAGDVGYPVIRIVSKGYLGTETANRGFREIHMDVARNKLQAQVEGAFTARSGVDAGGSSMTDGRNHDLAGNVVAGGTGCMADKPGITYDNGVVPTETCPNGNILGNPCVANHDPAAPGKSPLQKTPWGVLGLTFADFTGMFTQKPGSQLDMTECSPEKQYVWFSGQGDMRFNNASPCTNYSGIIVIHNTNFDPDQWEAKCFAGSTDAYCTADADADGNPDNAPAAFDMNGNVQWTGIVIADQVVKVNGNPVILGGIISLASGGVIESTITGNINIQYSCEAVSGASNQGYKTRLGWHRIH